jgi:alkylation response protein AidB-like acyl-CoA dehydrogenase
MPYRSSWMTEELDTFRDQFRKFLANDLAPHAERWRHEKMVDRSAWRVLRDMGGLLLSVPEVYDGLGVTFAYDAAVLEDMESVSAPAIDGAITLAPEPCTSGRTDEKSARRQGTRIACPACRSRWAGLAPGGTYSVATAPPARRICRNGCRNGEYRQYRYCKYRDSK